ncbi:hypothetical protein FSP39_005264 [Pinctada imbricata]|uniref:Galactose-3-O-sulfotransferase 3 n=1 Tax=Pinctada imbricata TaxID=66713 RepID=A0AA88XVI9_PINIB|nr:hypothetical protein FSP39_005264 [Pinctada imbricata]
MRRQKYLLAAAFLALMYLYSMQIGYVCNSFTEDEDLTIEQREYTGRSPRHCTEQTNIVFIKCMKCATETMGTIIRRFGYTRDLNFVLPVRHNIYLGWPFPIEKSDFRPSKRPYNILMEHSIHNHSFTSSFMSKNTSYITIIREPWNHFLSSFSYFGLRFIVAQPEINVTEYLSNVAKYERIYQSSEKKHFRECFPNGFSIIKNLMSHCMGMPLGFPEGRPDFSTNDSAINNFINDLENQFALVMIVDHFLESLVLLKRTLCWSFKDILFHRSNVNSNKYQKLPRSGKYYQNFKNFSRVDFILFDHFNRTLWRKIQAEGPTFFDEVEQFRVVQLLVERFCFIEGNHNTKSKNITIPASRFNEEFYVTSSDCDLMNKYLLIQIRERYNELELQGNKSAYWYANELSPKENPTRGCSFPKAQ